MGSLTLLAPLTLLGLLALPLVWWILKISPPAPKRRLFPPLAILKGVETEEETPNATPLWLLIYRLFMAALAVFALSLPLFQRDEADTSSALSLIIDDGPAAAPVWDAITDEARRRLREAQRANRDVILVLGDDPAFDPIPASEALQQLRSATPKLVQAVPDLSDLPADRATIFLSSGVSFGDDVAMLDDLRARNATIVRPEPSATVIVPGDVRETADGFETDWFSAHGARAVQIEVLSARGDVLAVTPIQFGPTDSLATGSISLPPQLRSRVTRLRIAGMRAGASTKLLDDSFGRPLVGVLAPPSGTSSPLLSEEFYAEQALQPFADLFSGNVDDVLSLNPSVLVMPDSMSSDAQAITDYVETGGVLIRFAGPQLAGAGAQDTLVPVELRRGGRSIGGALAWETPQSLAPFSAESPFVGLSIPDEVTVSRQVMARPGAETDARTWARLQDGAPVVTSTVRGEGRIILFHVTAGPEWSNLAISGLYVDMLKRILPLAKSRRPVVTSEGGDWTLDRLLGPFGELRPAPPQSIILPDRVWDDPSGSDLRGALPGYYRSGTRQRAVPTLTDPTSLRPVPTQGLSVTTMDGQDPRSLAGWLLGLAILMLALDVLLSAVLSGRLRRLTPVAAVALAMVLITGSPQTATANDRIAEAALGLHLAYIETGDARIDEMSQVAMESLSTQLTARTTIEPVGVHAVSASSEGLEMYPFLYWPIRNDTPAPTETERLALNDYIAAGGTLVLDTADEAERSFRAGAPHPGLARVTDGLTIGRLEPVPSDHVLTKSFYLLQVFPGRWANGPVYVEAGGATQGGRDGVSSVIIGSNDWAAGWAIDAETGTLVDLANDIPRQREMAVRFGVNIAMYALSGNYKADQVHAAELIRRLGDANAGDGSGTDSLDSIQDLLDQAREPR